MNKVYITGHSRGGFLTQRAASGIVADKTLKNIAIHQLEDFKIQYFNGMGVVFSKYAKDPIKQAELLGTFMALESIKSRATGSRVKGFPKGDIVSMLGCHVVEQKEHMVTDVALDNIEDTITAAHSMSNFTYHIMPYRYKK